MARNLPRWSDIQPLLKFEAPGMGAEARMRKVSSVWDMREIAKRRTPKGPFHYTDGGAGDEVTLQRSRQVYRDVEFQPGVLHDVSSIDMTTSVLGHAAAMPFGFGPTGFTRMMQHEGEPAVAKAAERAGIPVGLSTLGTTTPENLATAAPEANKWFQLYLLDDRDACRDLLNRAKVSGFTTAILTVDTPVGGDRRRDIRNGLTIPPSLSLGALFDMALHPSWWFNVLTTEPLQFASLSTFDGTVAELVNQIFDGSLDMSDVAWMKEHWDGPLVIKGIQTVEDARRAVDHGADGIVVSNHGGRQLDRTPATLELLPHVVDAVGDQIEVYVDGGIMSGADVVAAMCLGANMAFVGRAFLYALMAGGETGVHKLVELFRADIFRTMQLLGVSSLKELNRDHVKLKP